MSIEYIDLADYIAIAAAVTGLDLKTAMNMTNHDLADSALHAPSAGIADTDFYPDFVDKAAVLVVRLARIIPCQTVGAEAEHRRRRGSGARHRCGRMGRG